MLRPRHRGTGTSTTFTGWAPNGARDNSGGEAVRARAFAAGAVRDACDRAVRPGDSRSPLPRGGVGDRERADRDAPRTHGRGRERAGRSRWTPEQAIQDHGYF